jgi:hypothetical protein
MEFVVLEIGIVVLVIHTASTFRVEEALLLCEDGQALCSSEIFVSVYQITKCYISGRRS